jgi:mannosyltransferase OCH1-like enzyme
MMKVNTKIIDPGYAMNYLVKEYGKLPRLEDAVIPLKLHLFWHDKVLPSKMQKNVELLKRTNPEFEVVVYDGDMAREYIKTNFSGDVLHAYDTLIPISFKSDLFRYCVVYKEGGVYLDIKFEPVRGFKLLNFAKYREVWTSEKKYTINTCLIASTPCNPLLLRAIEMIKYNVENCVMGKSSTEVTGPQLLTLALLSIGDNYINNIVNYFKYDIFKVKAVFTNNVDDFNSDSDNKLYLTTNGSGGCSLEDCVLVPIFQFYKGYREELSKLSPQVHWSKMWAKGADFVFRKDKDKDNHNDVYPV